MKAPYIVDRLSSGSVVLGRRLGNAVCEWCAKGRREDLTGFADALGPIMRVALLAAGAWGGTYVVVAAPDTLWVVVLGWGIGAWRAAPAPSPDTASEKPAESEASVSRAPGPAVSFEDFSTLVRRLAQGGAGAHLSALAAHITGDPKDTAPVRALCREWGVPVSGSVRQPGRGVSTGVRVSDLPAPSPTPSESSGEVVVAAGQEPATGPTTTTATPTVERYDYGTTIYRDGTHHTVTIR